MFDDFTLEHVDVGEVTLRVRHGGAGTPVVLLHGHPRTHTTWHAVAPRLATRHHVVAPDLRGYGGSTLPPDAPDHAQSSKRAMARDVVRLMSYLGHDRFAVVGHDRGALVAFRAAMDRPDAVSHLVVMDGLPVLEHLERTDATFARAWWHWWFLGQTEKPAEPLINAAPEAWYRIPGPDVLGAGNHADLWAALRNPAVVHGMCEDYRAGLGIDRSHDAADRAAGRQVRCPVLLLESAHDDLDLQGDPAAIWAPWLARPLRHRVVDSGHHQAEQAPAAVAEALLDFLAP
ncbi:alpha/beta fold hydrolase [Actinoplanes teichomyceticus]|uniref:Haloacetate dehalogenase n=1 Tax=Actinoplanes teichomyceticus TaxID=1867 RepID=A0A561VKX4_ACTTI|nr:alpha/beta hydrolase [Actinoplanes teichomyceticus]TWG12266.1 haloacetate dehalogenase [Actinoplanes teichomyceticus]GIF14204.1 hydrolase [Actinoplanes teichomyceticus]